MTWRVGDLNQYNSIQPCKSYRLYALLNGDTIVMEESTLQDDYSYTDNPQTRKRACRMSSCAASADPVNMVEERRMWEYDIGIRSAMSLLNSRMQPYLYITARPYITQLSLSSHYWCTVSPAFCSRGLVLKCLHTSTDLS